MIINGTDLLLYYSTDDGVTWTALGYATSHSLSYAMTSRDVSHKKSGTAKKIEPSKTAFTGSAEGLVTYVADCDYHMLLGFITNRTPLKIAAAQDDSDTPDSNNIVTSDIYLSSVDITAGEEENSVYSISFEGNDDISHTSAGSTNYGTEYQAVYDSLTTKPASAIAEAQNTLVEALKTAGVWSKLDVFYMFAQASNGDGEALKNWKNPGTHDATEVNAPSFVALEGFTGNGVDSYLNLHYNPYTDGVNYSINICSGGGYTRGTRSDAYTKLFGGTDGTNYFGADILASGNIRAFMNETVASFAYTSYSGAVNGFFGYNRNGSACNIYHNGSDVGALVNQGQTGTTPDITIYGLALNNNDTGAVGLETLQVSCLWIGGNITAQNQIDFSAAVEAYMDSNSKGVI